MKNIYRHSENGFEWVASIAIAILGNSITFILALCLVIFWFSLPQFHSQDLHSNITDIILAIAFLSLFIIQKSSNRHSASIQLKLNELISSHKPANNAVINLERKTEHEIAELTKEYTELAEEVNQQKENKP